MIGHPLLLAIPTLKHPIKLNRKLREYEKEMGVTGSLYHKRWSVHTPAFSDTARRDEYKGRWVLTHHIIVSHPLYRKALIPSADRNVYESTYFHFLKKIPSYARAHPADRETESQFGFLRDYS